MTSISKILAAVCFVTVHAAAQWYDHPPSDLGYVPPIGWTYVLQSDSSEWFSSNVHNFISRHDSICYTVRTDLIHNYKTIVSINGGKDVSSVSPFYQSTEDSLSGYGGDYPNSFTKFMMIRRNNQSGSTYLCANSTDFGASFKDEHFFPENLQQFLRDVGADATDLSYYFVDCSPNNIYLSVNHGVGIYNSDDWFVSRDKGIHWDLLSFPYVPGRGGTSRDIVFDQFDLGVWYVVIQTGSGSASDCIVFRTDNDGLSFTPVPISCGQIDLGGPYIPQVTAGNLGLNTIRVPLTDALVPFGYVSVGISDFNDSGRVIRTSNWMRVIAPTKVNNTPKGDSFRISNVIPLSSDRPSGEYIITTVERIPNDTVAKKFRTETKIYKTTDDGDSWTELLWSSYLLINCISYDAFTHTLWAFASYDDEHQPISARTSVHLWKYVGVSTPVQEEPKLSLRDPSLFPNPASVKVNIHYYQGVAKLESLSIHDAFGQLVPQDYYKINKNESQVCEIEIGKTLCEGVYYLNATCGNNAVMLQLIIVR